MKSTVRGSSNEQDAGQRIEDVRNVSGQLVRICELAHERLDRLEQQTAKHG